MVLRQLHNYLRQFWQGYLVFVSVCLSVCMSLVMSNARPQDQNAKKYYVIDNMTTNPQNIPILNVLFHFDISAFSFNLMEETHSLQFNIFVTNNNI